MIFAFPFKQYFFSQIGRGLLLMCSLWWIHIHIIPTTYMYRRPCCIKEKQVVFLLATFVEIQFLILPDPISSF